jgi:hypothetical protein
MKSRRTKRVLLVVTGFAMVLGLGGAVVAAHGATPDFGLSASPSSASVLRGNQVQYDIAITRSNGFNSLITFSVSGQGSGASGSVSADPSGTASHRTLTVTTSSTAATGTSTLTVTGKSGSLTHTTQLSLTVTAPKFTLAVSPASANVLAGSSSQFAVAITRTNLSASIAFTVTGVPSQTTASFSPASTTGNITVLTVNTTSNTPAGTFALAIKGTSGSLTATVTAQLTVTRPPPPSFTLSVFPPTRIVLAGSSDQYAVTIDRTNLSAAVGFTVTGLPAHATASFSPVSTTGNITVLTVNTAANTPAGIFTLAIKGTSGSITRTISAYLLVLAPPQPSFILAVSPANVNVSVGLSGTFGVTISRTNLSAPIGFTVTGLPAHATASFSPVSTSGNSTTLTVNTASNTPLGSYDLVVKGTSGSVIATVTAHLTVSATNGQPFAIAGSLDRTLAPGVTGFLNLGLTNANNQPLSVTNLTVAISGTNKPACTTSNFAVTQFSAAYPIIVPANSTRTLSQLGIPQSAWPKIKMIDLPVNQDVCKSTGLTLSYAGSGQGN